MCRLMSLIMLCSRAKKTIPHVSSNIIVVRIAVARFEGMSLTPILAKMAVRAAKSAERIAYIFHMMLKEKNEACKLLSASLVSIKSNH